MIMLNRIKNSFLSKVRNKKFDVDKYLSSSFFMLEKKINYFHNNFIMEV